MQSIANLTLDSREVATMVEKQHCHLVRDIKKYIDVLLTNPKLDWLNFFRDSTYKDAKGETRVCYLLTRKGCEFVANKMTGKKGILFTANYINRFHEMEQELLKKQEAQPQTYQLKSTRKDFRELPSHLRLCLRLYDHSAREETGCMKAIMRMTTPENYAAIMALTKEFANCHRITENNKEWFMRDTGCSERTFSLYAEYQREENQ